MCIFMSNMCVCVLFFHIVYRVSYLQTRPMTNHNPSVRRLLSSVLSRHLHIEVMQRSAGVAAQ